MAARTAIRARRADPRRGGQGRADVPAGTLRLVSAPDPDAAGHQDGGDDRATAGAPGGRYLAPAPGAGPGGGPDRLTADHAYRSAAQERTGWSVANSFSAVGEDGQEDANGAAARRCRSSLTRSPGVRELA